MTGSRKAIQLALQTEDQDFFVRLGKALELHPIPPDVLARDKVKDLLLSEWVCRNSKRPRMAAFLRYVPLSDAPGDQIPLSFFTDRATADYCRAVISENLSDASVSKIRQRLG